MTVILKNDRLYIACCLANKGIGAIDFHCCPNIIVAIWVKHDEFTEEDIKNAIWHCSSSVTDKENSRTPRTTASGASSAVWKTIRKDFLSYAKFILERNS
jgi:hypothetical protein